MTTASSTSKWVESLSGHVKAIGAPASGPAGGEPGDLRAGPEAGAPAGWRWRKSLSVENLFTVQAGKDGLILVLLALPGRCYFAAHHFCRDGYMAHPPYPNSDILLELLLTAALLSAGTLLALSSMRGRYAGTGFVAAQFLVLEGVDLGSLVCLYLAVMAIAGARAWFRRTPRHGRAGRFIEECVWGLVGLVGSILFTAFCLWA